MKTENKSIVRSTKEIVFSQDRSDFVDEQVISRKFYNAFNYSKLPDGYKHLNLTIGVTSAKRGEGKTLVASNLAVSFALGYQRRTVLVDMNLTNPCIHKVFGAEAEPGLTESFYTGDIHLNKTKIDSLYILSAGNSEGESIGLQNIIQLRDVIRALEREFDFIIVDMPSITPIEHFPVLFVNEVDGLLAVVDAKHTKKEDLERIYQYVNDKQIVGYVFNRSEKDSKSGRRKAKKEN